MNVGETGFSRAPVRREAPGRFVPFPASPLLRSGVRYPLLREGAWGTPVSPLANRGWARLAPPQTRGWGTPVSPYVHGREGAWGTPVSPHVHGREGDGEPRFPHWPTAVGRGWRPTGRGAVRQAHRRWGNPVSPYVHGREGERGNPVSPHVHGRPHARGTQRQNENIIVLGRAQPSQTLPAGELFPGRA